MKNIIVIACILVGVAMISCKKNYDLVATTTDGGDAKAVLQVYNAVIGSATRNYVYISGTQATGAAFGYASVFPSSSYGFALYPGMSNIVIKDTLAATTQPQLNIISNFEPGMSYLAVMYDTVNKAKVALVPTPIVIPADTTARVRFANFAHAHTTVPNVEVWSKKRNEVIFTNVGFGQVTDFIPYASAINDTLVVRQAGSTTVLLDTLNGFNPTIRRSYTLIFRGRYLTNEAGGAANPRTLSVIVNH